MKNLYPLLAGLSAGSLFSFASHAQQPAGKKQAPPPPGVSTPGVRREMSAIRPQAVFSVEGAPDWDVVTEDSVWLCNLRQQTVWRIALASLK